MDDVAPPTAADQVRQFFSDYRLRRYPKGQVLLLNDDVAEHVYYLVSGRVRTYDVSYRGDEIVLNVFKPPAFFPMSPALSGRPSAFIYEAETAVEVRQAPVSEVVDFVRQHPDVLYDLLTRVYSGMDGLLGRMSRLMAGNARSRIIYELIIEADRFGKTREDGSIVLSVSERTLGDNAGLTRETVSREVSRLKSEGLVGMEGTDIVINDIGRLRELETI